MNWRRAMWRFVKHRGGATAMEFTFVMLPMIVLIFGSIQFGGILYLKNDMQNAARDAARRTASGYLCIAGAPVQCGSALPNHVEELACNYLTDWTPAFEVNATQTGDDMEVTISTDMGAAAIVDLFGIFQGKTMSATAIMRQEFTPPSPPPFACP